MPRSRLLPAAVVAAALSAVALAPSAAAPTRVSEFVAHCSFSHRAADDPIVHPGHPGAAHSHDFFGNRSVDAHSTLRSLRRAKTTCDPRSDRAAYWFPTLYLNGKPVKPRRATFYT